MSPYEELISSLQWKSRLDLVDTCLELIKELESAERKNQKRRDEYDELLEKHAALQERIKTLSSSLRW